MQGLRVRVDVWADEVLADLFGKLCAASATDADSAIHESRQFLHIQVQAQAQAGPGRAAANWLRTLRSHITSMRLPFAHLRRLWRLWGWPQCRESCWRQCRT